ncbi:MAG TPA: hypothetical protein VMV10_27110 [Pirellulales bacterium]|nr:hypothetical protein [Pirellulales bacterium]
MSRRFQFSLKWLFVLMLIASLGAAFVHYDRLAKIARAEVELRHCQEIEAKVKRFTGDVAERAIWDAEDETKDAARRLQSLKSHLPF